MDQSEKSKTCKYCKQNAPMGQGKDCCYPCWKKYESATAKPLQKCPECGNDGCRDLHKYDGRQMCFVCREKVRKAEKEKLEAERKAFKDEGERVMAAERDIKKAEALKQQPGRTELGHWVENIDGMQFMTKITAVSAASVMPRAQRWLWRDRIPVGAITWGVGKPGTCDLVRWTPGNARPQERVKPDSETNPCRRTRIRGGGD